MSTFLPLLLIAGGLLACATMLVSRSANAKAVIDGLMPFQALIGAVLFVAGLWTLFAVYGLSPLMRMLEDAPLVGAIYAAQVVCAVGLGLLFGLPMLARVSPVGAALGEELRKQVAPYQTLIGVIAIVAALGGYLVKAGVIGAGTLSL
jgi:hypothetical protein